MRGDDLRKRTKSFALRVIKLVEVLPKGSTLGVQHEAEELLAIIVASIKTAKKTVNS